MTAPDIRSIQHRSTFAALRKPAGRATRGPLRVAFVPTPGRPPESFSQVGYTIGRRCGNAVTRNRLRRRLRAVMAELASDLHPGAYLVGVEPGAGHLNHDELVSTLHEALDAAAVRASVKKGAA